MSKCFLCKKNKKQTECQILQNKTGMLTGNREIMDQLRIYTEKINVITAAGLN